MTILYKMWDQLIYRGTCAIRLPVSIIKDNIVMAIPSSDLTDREAVLVEFGGRLFIVPHFVSKKIYSKYYLNSTLWARELFNLLYLGGNYNATFPSGSTEVHEGKT